MNLQYPPLWARQQHARLSRSRPGFDPRSGQVSWVRFFRGFSSPIRQMSGSFRPPRSPNIIWPSLSFIMGANDLRCWCALKPQIYKHTYESTDETSYYKEWKLGFSFYLMFHKPQHGFHQWHGKCLISIQPRPLCCEASVVWHCWQQHKFVLLSLPNYLLVSCRPGT